MLHLRAAERIRWQAIGDFLGRPVHYVELDSFSDFGRRSVIPKLIVRLRTLMGSERDSTRAAQVSSALGACALMPVSTCKVRTRFSLTAFGAMWH